MIVGKSPRTIEDQIVEMLMDGKRHAEIRSELGVTRYRIQVVMKARGIAGQHFTIRRREENRKREVIRLAKAGYSVNDMADMLDVHPNTIRDTMRKLNGPDMRRITRPRRTAARRQRVAQLMHDMTPTEIARRLGVHRATVWKDLQVIQQSQ